MVSPDDGAGSEWDEAAAGWDDDPFVRAYAAAAYSALGAAIHRHGFDLGTVRACDFGCGTGLLTERLAQQCAHVDAVDPSPAMLAVVREKIDRHRWSHVRALDALPTDPQRYDLVVCSSVLAFVDDHRATVKALLDQQASHGLFVQWDWERTPEDDIGFTRAEIGEALSAAGYDDVTVDVGFEVTLDDTVMRPLMAVGRRRR